MRRYDTMKRVADGAVRSASMIRAARAMSYLAADPMRQPVIVSAVRTPIGRCACLAIRGSVCVVCVGVFVSTSSLHGVCGVQTPELGPRDTAHVCISARLSNFISFLWWCVTGRVCSFLRCAQLWRFVGRREGAATGSCCNQGVYIAVHFPPCSF
jgi:hypothetical protein